MINVECFPRDRIHLVVGNRPVATQDTFDFDGWTIPNAGPREIGLALKSARSRPSNDIRRVVAQLAGIGRDGTWINDDELSLISQNTGTALSYLRRSIGRLNEWMAGLGETMAGHGEPDVLGYRTNDGYWRGGLTTAMILAGDATAVGPLALAHGLLAGARIVAKGSRYEPLAPYLFLREVVRRGLQAPDILFFDTKNRPAEETVGPLLKHSRQSVVYGADETVNRLYASASVPISHKRIAFWSGRSGVLVLDDADPRLAARIILEGTAEDRGNRCYSTMKAFVPEESLDRIVGTLIAGADALRRGSPNDPDVDIGRLEADGRRLMEASLGVSEVIYDRDVVFVRVQDRDALLREEIPYPVCAIRPYQRGEDPVALSNASTDDGIGDGALAMAVVCATRDRFHEVASRMNATKIVHNRPTVDIDHTATHQGIYLFREMMRFTAAY